MMSKKVVFIAILLVAIAAAASLISRDEIKTFVLRSYCLEQEGKWASNGAYCISQHCAADGTCLPSVDNNAVCSRLPLPPLTSSFLYFELGMPERQDGDTYIFKGGAMGNPITAKIENDVATQLDCGL